LIRLLYKPWSVVFRVLGAFLANKLFTKLWSLVAHEEAPDPRQRNASWKAILPAAALEGAIYAASKAAAERASARAFEHSTGVWPADKKSKKH
jgi:hypothetical protein